MNIGVLASHEGTTLQAVLDGCAQGRIAGRVAVVISNNAASGALRRARHAGVAAVHLSAATALSPQALDRDICEALSAHQVDLVLLAGYMKRLGPATLQRFAGRVINTHPALLPGFGGRGMYGMHVHRAVLAAAKAAAAAKFTAKLAAAANSAVAMRAADAVPGSAAAASDSAAAGEFLSGASVHWVDPDYDTGPVIARVTVAVKQDDTAESLAQRVQGAERDLLVAVLADAAAGRLHLPHTATGAIS